MKKDNVISLQAYRPAQQATSRPAFDPTAYERRSARRFQLACLRAAIVTAVETAVTVAIGVCVVVSTLLVCSII